MKYWLKEEKGAALPLALIAIAIGALVVPTFLQNTGTSLLGARNYGQAVYSGYSADAGAEHAIWRLTNDGLAATLDMAGESINYSLAESLNGLGTSVTVSNGWETLASDDFESGGWAGGTGWAGNWFSSGDASVNTAGTPYAGTYHLRLRSDDGYASRAIDLTGESNVRVRFYAKANSFEPTETAVFRVSENGVDWTTLRTWQDGDDDNVYHFYSFDLSSFNMTSQFQIEFEANMSGTGDYFYVDNLEIIWYFEEPAVAEDDFESGNGSGGTGWIDNWTLTGDALVTTSGTAYEGSYHLRLRSADGYAARSVDMSGQLSMHLRFRAKANSFEPGETAICQVSENGTSWTTVYTWQNGDDDNIYRFYDIDLSSFNPTSQFWIAFDANMSGTGDYFYVDRIRISGLSVYGITSTASGRSVKATVKIDGGAVSVLTWYIR